MLSVLRNCRNAYISLRTKASQKRHVISLLKEKRSRLEQQFFEVQFALYICEQFPEDFKQLEDKINQEFLLRNKIDRTNEHLSMLRKGVKPSVILLQMLGS
jgi:vacuolar-type H+-ATPase subunit D/Vma8